MEGLKIGKEKADGLVDQLSQNVGEVEGIREALSLREKEIDSLNTQLKELHELVKSFFFHLFAPVFFCFLLLLSFFLTP